MPAIKQHDWKIPSSRENAQAGVLVTDIYPIREGIAMMVTNSFGGIRMDTWMIFERFMQQIDANIETRVRWIASETHLTDALNIMRKYAWGVYQKDIATERFPF